MRASRRFVHWGSYDPCVLYTHYVCSFLLHDRNELRQLTRREGTIIFCCEAVDIVRDDPELLALPPARSARGQEQFYGGRLWWPNILACAPTGSSEELHRGRLLETGCLLTEERPVLACA